MKRPALLTFGPKVSFHNSMKEAYASFRSLFLAVMTLPKVPIQTLDSALCAWGIDSFDPVELERYRRSRLFSGCLCGVLFFLIIFFSCVSLWNGTFGILSFIEVILAGFAALVMTSILFWQTDVLASGKFISFLEYIKKGKWLFSVFFLCFFAAADISAVNATDLFPDIEIQNQSGLSSAFIGSVIGDFWFSTFAKGGAMDFVGVSSVLIPILTLLNMIALFFITVFAVYIFTFGTVHISNTGRWEDSQIFSTFWSPLRTAAAIAFCSPLSNGISFLHYLILVAIAMSINLANNINDTFLNFATENDTNMFQLASPVIPSAETNYPMIFQTVLHATVLQKAYTNILNGDEDFKSAYDVESVHVKDSEDTLVRRIVFSPLPSMVFPTIEVLAGNAKYGMELQNAYIFAIEDLILQMNDLCEKYIAKNIEDRFKVSEEELEGILRTMYGNFENKINAERKKIVLSSKNDNHVSSIIEKMQSSGKMYGWLMFGTYPFALAQAQSILQKSTEIEINVKGNVSGDELAGYVNENFKNQEMKVVWEFFKRVTDKISDLRIKTGMNYGMESENIDSPMFISKKLMKCTGLSIEDIVKDFTSANPIAVMFSKGENIVFYSAFALTALGAAAGGVKSKIMEGAEGKGKNFAEILHKIIGGKFGKAGAAFYGAISVWMPLLVAIVGMFILFGISCCYILPLLPILYWGRAVVTWAILVVETLMGAPFWAAAHVFPEGIGLAGQHARRGYMMLMDVFIRPALLCAGAIMSMLLMETIIRILALILRIWVEVVHVSANYGFIGYIAVSCLAIYIIYSSIRFIYLEAIGNFPYKVLSWCGGLEATERDTGTRYATETATTVTSTIGTSANQIKANYVNSFIRNPRVEIERKEPAKTLNK